MPPAPFSLYLPRDFNVRFVTYFIDPVVVLSVSFETTIVQITISSFACMDVILHQIIIMHGRPKVNHRSRHPMVGARTIMVNIYIFPLRNEYDVNRVQYKCGCFLLIRKSIPGRNYWSNALLYSQYILFKGQHLSSGPTRVKPTEYTEMAILKCQQH